ncbi:hypothetical protein [Geodermatophilus sp. SYSU D01036]
MIGGAGLMLVTAVPASAQAAALVFITRDAVDCWTDEEDVPFLPPFPIGNSTVVETPSGGINVSCFGRLPEDLAAPAQTYVGSVPCYGPTTTVEGRIVITTSGRVSLQCHFPSA